MKTYLVSIQVVEVHNVEVKAKNQDEAVSKASLMPVSKIRENGSMVSIETEYAEIID